LHDTHEQDRLALDTLTVALALSAWVAFGSLVLAALDGLGEHPVRRGAIGVLLLAGLLLALRRRRDVCAALRRWPQLVVAVAAAQIAAAVADQPVGGAYVAVSLTSIGLAILAARTRTVWLCVLVLEAIFVAAVLIQSTPAQLADDGDLGGVVGVVLSYPVIALLLLALRSLFGRFRDGAERLVLEIRAGAPVLTPALAQAVALPDGPLLLEAGAPAVALTPAEVAVVEGLAAGLAPKQLAFERKVKLSTVRTHIKHAKRKTGARTLRELAALPSRPGWPDPSSFRR
jgi:DNA-binding CsgD family transcriptional regulator